MIQPSEVTNEMLDAFNRVLFDLEIEGIELYSLSTAIAAAINAQEV